MLLTAAPGRRPLAAGTGAVGQVHPDRCSCNPVCAGTALQEEEGEALGADGAIKKEWVWLFISVIISFSLADMFQVLQCQKAVIFMIWLISLQLFLYR